VVSPFSCWPVAYDSSDGRFPLERDSHTAFGCGQVSSQKIPCLRGRELAMVPYAFELAGAQMPEMHGGSRCLYSKVAAPHKPACHNS